MWSYRLLRSLKLGSSSPIGGSSSSSSARFGLVRPLHDSAAAAAAAAGIPPPPEGYGRRIMGPGTIVSALVGMVIVYGYLSVSSHFGKEQQYDPLLTRTSAQRAEDERCRIEEQRRRAQKQRMNSGVRGFVSRILGTNPDQD